jgi:hypothetical protein
MYRTLCAAALIADPTDAEKVAYLPEGRGPFGAAD